MCIAFCSDNLLNPDQPVSYAWFDLIRVSSDEKGSRWDYPCSHHTFRFSQKEHTKNNKTSWMSASSRSLQSFPKSRRKSHSSLIKSPPWSRSSTPTSGSKEQRQLRDMRSILDSRGVDVRGPSIPNTSREEGLQIRAWPDKSETITRRGRSIELSRPTVGTTKELMSYTQIQHDTKR